MRYLQKKVILLPPSDVSELIGDVLLVLLVVLFFFLSLRFFLFSLINFTSEDLGCTFARLERTFEGRGCKISFPVAMMTVSAFVTFPS